MHLKRAQGLEWAWAILDGHWIWCSSWQGQQHTQNQVIFHPRKPLKQWGYMITWSHGGFKRTLQAMGVYSHSASQMPPETQSGTGIFRWWHQGCGLGAGIPTPVGGIQDAGLGLAFPSPEHACAMYSLAFLGLREKRHEWLWKGF